MDADVLIDVVVEDPHWASWSARALAAAADSGPLVINPVVYAEVSVAFDTLEELDAVLGDDLVREALPYPAGFLAGKAFLAYRRNGGLPFPTSTSVRMRPLRDTGCSREMRSAT